MLFRGVRFAVFKISNFRFAVWSLLTNIFTEISGNVAVPFLDFMAFSKLNRSRVWTEQRFFYDSPVGVSWGVFGHANTVPVRYSALLRRLFRGKSLHQRGVFRAKFPFMRVFFVFTFKKTNKHRK